MLILYCDNSWPLMLCENLQITWTLDIFKIFGLLTKELQFMSFAVELVISCTYFWLAMNSQ